MLQLKPYGKSQQKQLFCSFCQKYQSYEKDDKGDMCCLDCGKIITTDNFDYGLQFTDQKKDGQVVDIKKSERDRTKEAERFIQEMVFLLKLKTDYPDHYEMISETPLRIIKYAYNGFFLDHGSNIKHYSAAALYIALRFYKAPFLLMDFSEKLSVNLFKLAKCYRKLAKFLNVTLKLNEQLPPVDPSLYIPRFCKELDFKDRAEDVSRTALRLLKRMKLDWISHGRRPSSLCGAAILIAAHMEHLQCTTHQVSNIVHVCEETLRRRLEEFQDTDTAKLTKDQFNQFEDVKEIGGEKNPPSFMKQPKKKSRQNTLGNALLDSNNNNDNSSNVMMLNSKELSETNDDVGDSLQISQVGNIHMPQSGNQQQQCDSSKYEQEMIGIMKDMKDEFSYDLISPNNANNLLMYNNNNNQVAEQNLSSKEIIEQALKQQSFEEEEEEQKRQLTDSNCKNVILYSNNQVNDQLCTMLNVQEDLSDLGEDERGQYILSDQEQNVKRVIWHSMNSVWLQEQQDKEQKAKIKTQKKRNKRRNDQLLNEDQPILALFLSKKMKNLDQDRVNVVLNQQIQYVLGTKLGDIFQKKQNELQQQSFDYIQPAIHYQDQKNNTDQQKSIQNKNARRLDDFEFDDDDDNNSQDN